jgi:hypothetical protein
MRPQDSVSQSLLQESSNLKMPTSSSKGKTMRKKDVPKTIRKDGNIQMRALTANPTTPYVATPRRESQTRAVKPLRKTEKGVLRDTSPLALMLQPTHQPF